MARKDPIDHDLMASGPLAPEAYRRVPVSAAELQDVPGAAVLAAFLTPDAAGAEPMPDASHSHAAASGQDVSEAYQFWLALLSRYADRDLH